MSDSKITPALQYVKAGLNFQERIYQLTFSAGNYESPVTLDFTTATNPDSQPAAAAWQNAAVVGYKVDNGPVDYQFELIAGSANDNWGLKISTAGAELTPGAALPAAITAATDILISLTAKTNKSA